MAINQKLLDRIDHDFSLHPPQSETIGETLDALRDLFKTCASAVTLLCPESRELSLAITDLDNGLMHAIAAVARNQDAAEATVAAFNEVEAGDDRD